MIRTLTALSALMLAAPAAHATTTACFDGQAGQPLQGMRVVYAPSLWSTFELETDSAGCVDIPTSWWTSSATVTIHATNRVVMVVEKGIGVADTRTVTDGSTTTLGDDHTLAENLRLDYENGLRGYGPFQDESPVGGTLAKGPYLSADLSSWMLHTYPYVEPAPVGGVPPRLHLDAQLDGYTPHHELAHALHISQWPDTLKTELELYYIGWLLGEDGPHGWNSPSTAVVAYVEAFGGVGETFEAVGTGLESDFLEEAADLAEVQRKARSGDDTIEAVVFGVLFDEFASAVGLDYVVDTYISCEVLTLQEYAVCISDMEGSGSDIFVALRQAGWEYGVQFADAPKPWDWNFCGNGFVCDAGEGDCDFDSDCSGANICLDDVGPAYGKEAWVDVCGRATFDNDLFTK